MGTIDITLDQFEDLVTADGTVIMDFWASWCGPCRTFAPVFEEASQRHTGVTFAKVDTEAEQVLAGALGIRSIPTLMVFRDGIQVFRQAGALPGHVLENLLEQVAALDMDEVRRQVAEHQAEHQHGPDCDH